MFLTSEVLLYVFSIFSSLPHLPAGGLSFDNVFQERSARYRAVEPEQWLQRHPEAGSSWPSWPKALQVVGEAGMKI